MQRRCSARRKPNSDIGRVDPPRWFRGGRRESKKKKMGGLGGKCEKVNHHAVKKERKSSEVCFTLASRPSARPRATESGTPIDGLAGATRAWVTAISRSSLRPIRRQSNTAVGSCAEANEQRAGGGMQVAQASRRAYASLVTDKQAAWIEGFLSRNRTRLLATGESTRGGRWQPLQR